MSKRLISRFFGVPMVDSRQGRRAATARVERIEPRVLFSGLAEHRGVNDLGVFGSDAGSYTSHGGNMHTWGVDMVRENVPDFDQVPVGTGSAAAPGGGTLHGLQAVVNDIQTQVGAGTVTILCPFTWNNTQILASTPSSTAYYAAYKTRLAAEATQFGGQSNVWLETWNEPYTVNSPTTWLSDMEDMVHSIRTGTGFTGKIVIPGSNYGGNETPILAQGQTLVNYDPQHNIVFDLHAYSNFIYGQTSSQIATRIQTILNTGVDLVFGEFGPAVLGTSNFDDVSPFITAVQQEHVSALAWHWNDNDSGTLHNTDGSLNNTAANYNWANQAKAYTTAIRTVQASGLPSGWTNTNINAPAISGSATSTGAAAYTVKGEGDNITGFSDQFDYAAGTVTGNKTMVSRITGLTNTNASASAGVMFRDSTAINAAFVQVSVTPSGVVQFTSRSSAGSTSSANGSVSTGITPSLGTPVWVKLVRSGTTYTAYYSTSTAQPTTWTQIGSAISVTFGNTSYLSGLAVCSANTSMLATAMIDYVDLF